MIANFHRTILRVFASLLIICGFPTSSIFGGENGRLDLLLSQYREHIADTLDPLRERMTADLISFEKSLTTKGNLQAAIDLREARISGELTKPGSDPVDFPIDIMDFAKTFPDTGQTLKRIHSQHESRTDAALISIRRKMIAALSSLEKKQVKSGNLKTALQTQRYQEKLQAILNWPATKMSIPKSAEEMDGHFYLRVEDKLSWQDARTYCVEKGGHLATISSDDENVFVRKLAKGRPCWLGASDEKVEGQWEWVTGEPFVWRGLGGSADNHDDDEHFLSFGDTGRWNDLSNVYKIRFICEWGKPESLYIKPKKAN